MHHWVHYKPSLSGPYLGMPAVPTHSTEKTTGPFLCAARAFDIGKAHYGVLFYADNLTDIWEHLFNPSATVARIDWRYSRTCPCSDVLYRRKTQRRPLNCLGDGCWRTRILPASNSCSFSQFYHFNMVAALFGYAVRRTGNIAISDADNCADGGERDQKLSHYPSATWRVAQVERPVYFMRTAEDVS